MLQLEWYIKKKTKKQVLKLIESSNNPLFLYNDQITGLRKTDVVHHWVTAIDGIPIGKAMRRLDKLKTKQR